MVTITAQKDGVVKYVAEFHSTDDAARGLDRVMTQYEDCEVRLAKDDHTLISMAPVRHHE
jgi:hypothetical protein